jgi:hypothetical protein
MVANRKQLKASQPRSKTAREGKNPVNKNEEPIPKQDEHRSKYAVRQDPDDVASLIARKALDAHLDCAKELARILSEKKSTPPLVKKHHGLTCAQRLALDPPWVGLPEDDEDEYDDEEEYGENQHLDQHLIHDLDRDFLPPAQKSPTNLQP